MKLPDLIQINIPFIVILLLAGLGALLSYLHYKKTLPEVSASWRWSLAILRGLVVFLLLLIFFRPQLTVFYHKQKQKKVAVFVDRSQSMTVQDDSLPRWRQEQQAVEKIRSFSVDGLTLDWYGFHSKVFPMKPDSLQPTLYGTNLLNVTQKADRLNPDAAILISDGNYTEGAYPAADQWSAHTPLFTIGLGKRFAEADLFIQEVNYEPVAYQGKPQKIIARVGARAINRAFRATVYLKVNGKAVSSAALHIQPQTPLQDVVLNYTPQNSGEARLQVQINRLPEEKNTANNRQTHLQKVLKGKIKIAVISGAVDYESKFLKQLLNAQEDVDCDLFVQVKNNRWIGGNRPQLQNCDVLILSNFPGAYTTAGSVKEVLQLIIQRRRCGLLFVTGKYVNEEYLRLFQEYLPFRKLPWHITTIPTLQIMPQENESGALLQIFDDKSTLEQFWQKVPPLEISAMGGKLKKETEILLTGLTLKGRIPLLITRQMRGQRSAVLNGSGFWKWHFLLQELPELSKGYANLLHLLVRWLSEKQKLQQVLLQSAEKTHYLGRPVHLKAYLFDAAYRPVREGQVKIEVLWHKQKFYLDAGKAKTATDSVGLYRASFIPPGEGKYRVTAVGYQNNLPLGNDRLVFEVIPFEKELLDTRQNSLLLKEMAAASGGKYFTISGLDSLKEILKAAPQMIRIKKSLVLWDSLYLLFAILGLIVIEWALRKFKGLA